MVRALPSRTHTLGDFAVRGRNRARDVGARPRALPEQDEVPRRRQVHVRRPVICDVGELG